MPSTHMGSSLRPCLNLGNILVERERPSLNPASESDGICHVVMFPPRDPMLWHGQITQRSLVVNHQRGRQIILPNIAHNVSFTTTIINWLQLREQQVRLYSGINTSLSFWSLSRKSCFWFKPPGLQVITPHSRVTPDLAPLSRHQEAAETVS